MYIKEFISKEWSAYADYDNRRSLPHLIDGLKITQRKAMFTATRLPANDKAIKVSQFASKAAEETAYHHGDTSMISTVVCLAQDYPGSNNYPFLEKHGQFGSRLSNEPAAPRYIHTKIHENWKKFFKAVDQEIVEYNSDDGKDIEPKFFIPILPTILLNGSDGVGNGYKSNILSYDAKDVARAIREIIKNKKIKTPLIPKVFGFNGRIDKVDRQVSFYGTLKVVNTTKIHITELPPGYDNDKYKKLLNKLIDDKKIKDYENNSTESKWDWVISCPRETSALKYDELLDLFGLITRVSENFVCWGVNSPAPLTFDTPEQLVEKWFEERIKLYQLSLENQIKTTKKKILRLNLRMLFIKWCLKNDFRKLSKKEFIDKTTSEIKGMTQDIATDFVGMSMYKITTDEVEKSRNEMESALDELDILEQKTPISVMEQDISAF